MHGRRDPQATMLAFVDLEERVSKTKDHPIRTIKAVADEALGRLSPEFDRMCAKVGRASVPPERLLKTSLLISLYWARRRDDAGVPENRHRRTGCAPRRYSTM